MKVALKKLAIAGTICLASACGSQNPAANPHQGTLKFTGGANALSTTSEAACYTATIQVYSDDGADGLVAFGTPQTLSAGADDNGVVQAVLACDTTASTGNAVVVMTLSAPPTDCVAGDPAYNVIEGAGPFTTQQEGPCFEPSSGKEFNVNLDLPFTVINQSIGDVDVTASVEVNQISESMKIPDCKPFLNDNSTNSILNGLAIQPAPDAVPIQPGLFDLRYVTGFDGNQISADPAPTERWLELQTNQLYSYTSAIAAPTEAATSAAPTASIVAGAAFFDLPSSAHMAVPEDGMAAQLPGQFLERVPMAVTKVTVNEDGTCQGSDDNGPAAPRSRGQIKDAWTGGDTQASTTIRDSGDGYKLVCHCGSSSMNLTASCSADNAWDCYPGGQAGAAAFCTAGCGGATVIPDTGNQACTSATDPLCPNGGGVAFVATVSTAVQGIDGQVSTTTQSLNLIYAVDAALYEPIFDTRISQNTFNRNEQIVELLNCSSNFVPVGLPPAMEKRLALDPAMEIGVMAGPGPSDFVQQPDTFLGVITFTDGVGYNYYTLEIPADGITVPIFQSTDASMVNACD